MICTDPTTIQEGDLIAAIDIGSNSFHLIIARLEHGEPRTIDRLRDNVRMAAGLRANGSLSSDCRSAAMECLARFGQRIATIPSSHVRVVATNSIRRLAAPQHFLSEAEAVLGHPVNVVSGHEEARLIFLGVTHGLPLSDERRLVIDIGGGSTEFIIGHGLTPLHTQSVQAGCIASTQRFFSDVKLTKKRWKQAKDGIRLLLQPFAKDYRKTGWGTAYGSSGSANAIHAMVRAMALSDHGITKESLDILRETLLAQGRINTLKLPGLTAERAPVIAGALVILETAFDTLGIEQLYTSDNSMREGMLWDLIGHTQATDPRTISVNALAKRYHVDEAQTDRVLDTALMLFDQIASSWKLSTESRKWLSWAAKLHEIGLAIAHTQYHHHGFYILRHADLSGFSSQEQQLLATLVATHRRKPDKATFAMLPLRYRQIARYMAAVLRLATLLRRSRHDASLPPIRLVAKSQNIELHVPAAWLKQHPLTASDLQHEVSCYTELGLILTVNPSSNGA